MTATAIIQLAVLVVLMLATAPVLGAYLARVHGGGPAPGDAVFGPVERWLYRACRVDPPVSSGGAPMRSRCWRSRRCRCSSSTPSSDPRVSWP